MQQAYADAMAATNDDDYQARMRTYARAVSENAASDWLYTRKNFMAVSDQLQGYPKNLTDRLLPLMQSEVAVIFPRLSINRRTLRTIRVLR